MKRFAFLLVLAMTLCFIGCSKALPPQTTGATNSSVPSQTTETIALSIPWKGPDTRFFYSYEDYFTFERVFNGVGEELSEFILTDGYTFSPYTEKGILYLKDTQGKLCFQVGSEAYENLRIFGTDGSHWIYCAEAGRELFRVDPFGCKEVLYTDETERIGSGSLDSGSFRLEDQNNLAYFTAGTENGYGIYRIHLPSMQVDLLAEEQSPITLRNAVSNYQITYFVGEYIGGSETILSTSAKEWNLSDPNIQTFQQLLSPGKNEMLNGVNNWYNTATFLLFGRPEEVSLSALMCNGFGDLSTKLTDEELTALGDTADPEQDYFKLPIYRIDQVLQTLFGLRIGDLARNTLAENKEILYHADTETYYMPCSMHYDSSGQLSVYIWSQDIQVHKVVEMEDGTSHVYYLPYTPYPFRSAQDWEEHVMVLKKDGSGYRILSNSIAVLPMEN